MANLKNINFMSGTQFTNLETTKEDELYAVNVENDATFKSFVSGIGMPSSKNVNLTLGDSGSTYTAPSNGYFYMNRGMKSAGDNFHFSNNTRVFSSPTVGWNGASRATRTVMPVIKGDVVACVYNGSG